VSLECGAKNASGVRATVLSNTVTVLVRPDDRMCDVFV
jgi:hypothetical protein